MKVAYTTIFKKMSKTVIISESSIDAMRDKKNVLPRFVYRAMKEGNTPLSDNEAIPDASDAPFLYHLLKDGYIDAVAEIEENGMEEILDMSVEDAVNELGSLMRQCKEIEAPIRPALEKICWNSLVNKFGIPNGVINMELSLVDKVHPETPYRVLPEMAVEDDEYEFEDTEEISAMKRAMSKRMMVNALAQGAAMSLSSFDDYIIDEVSKISERLIPLYNQIVALNNLLIYRKKEDITDKDPKQASYVEVRLGATGERSTLKAQALIFPLLYQEAIKGLFELFAAHGLPSDTRKAKYIIKRCDFIAAEPWNMRYGKRLWEIMFGNVEETEFLPYLFKALVSMRMDDFNRAMREMLAKTKAGRDVFSELELVANDDYEYDTDFDLEREKYPDKSLIADGYFTASELDSLALDDEPEEGDIINEDGESNRYAELLMNADWRSFDFKLGEKNRFANALQRVYLFVDGTRIPIDVVSLQAYDSLNGKKKLHIFLDDELEGTGVREKIYAAFNAKSA